MVVTNSHRHNRLGRSLKVAASAALILLFGWHHHAPISFAQDHTDHYPDASIVDPNGWLGPLSELALDRLMLAANANECALVILISNTGEGNLEHNPEDEALASLMINTSIDIVDVEESPRCESVQFLAAHLATTRAEAGSTLTPELVISAIDEWGAPHSRTVPEITGTRHGDVIEESPVISILLPIFVGLAVVLAVLWMLRRTRPYR